MKTFSKKESWFAILFVCIGSFVSGLATTFSFTSCSNGSIHSESKWKTVSNLEQFKSQIKGTTWVAYYSDYDSKIVIEDGFATAYTDLHYGNSGWGMKTRCSIEYVEYNTIQVQLTDMEGHYYGTLIFESDGTPVKFLNAFDSYCGSISLVE